MFDVILDVVNLFATHNLIPGDSCNFGHILKYRNCRMLYLNTFYGSQVRFVAITRASLISALKL